MTTNTNSTVKAGPRVLVVTADLGGNLSPTLIIARRLLADGATVHVLGHPAQQAAVTAAGLAFSAYTRARAYPPTGKHSSSAGLWGLIQLVCDQGVGADLVEVAARERSQLLLVDNMLLAGLRTGHRSGLPTVALVHSLPAFFTGRWAHSPIGAAATLRGLRPGKVWGELSGAVTVCLPELVGADTALSGPVVGPVWPGTPRATSSAAARDRRPRVLIGLSTFPWPGMDAVASRILDAVATMDLDVVFTTGPALDPDQLQVPGNVDVHRFVDHSQLMPDVDLMITHGGHGTAMRALAHDLPLLMLPLHPMCDQPAIAQAITHHGAGLTLSRTASPQAIREAVQQLLTQPRFHTAAARLGGHIRARDAAAAASTYLRTMLEHSHTQGRDKDTHDKDDHGAQRPTPDPARPARPHLRSRP